MPRAALLTLVLLADGRADEDDGFSTGVSSYAAADVEDAERFLSRVGVPSGLPQLEIKYPEGGWGKKATMKGSESHFDAATTDVSFAAEPQVTWVSGRVSSSSVPSLAMPRKFAILMVSPDYPERLDEDDGARAGQLGPYVHWMALNCEESSKDCAGFLPYELNAPGCSNMHPVHVYTCASSCVWHVYTQVRAQRARAQHGHAPLHRPPPPAGGMHARPCARAWA